MSLTAQTRIARAVVAALVVYLATAIVATAIAVAEIVDEARTAPVTQGEAA